jgi:hypothetical protein
MTTVGLARVALVKKDARRPFRVSARSGYFDAADGS